MKKKECIGPELSFYKSGIGIQNTGNVTDWVKSGYAKLLLLCED